MKIWNFPTFLARLDVLVRPPSPDYVCMLLMPTSMWSRNEYMRELITRSSRGGTQVDQAYVIIL